MSENPGAEMRQAVKDLAAERDRYKKTLEEIAALDQFSAVSFDYAPTLAREALEKK